MIAHVTPQERLIWAVFDFASNRDRIAVVRGQGAGLIARSCPPMPHSAR
ncbi:hypothetical protein Z950_1521 [Sulfitobacter mediterraneus KCTC 32188]|nr:hypothetical protein Z950_1521 [Sulfitobacter mediterraneus KCTC 32188]